MSNKKEILLNNNKKYSLSLDYILGLFEGDGSIYIQLKPNISHKTGKQVILNWDIHQHAIDVDLLHAISKYLNCGKVEIGRKVGEPESWVYRFRISTQAEILNILLPILESNDMVLNKRNHDKKIFIEICKLILNKEHITFKGQEKIIKLSDGLSSKLDLRQKSSLEDSTINLSDDRVLGLTDAEGNFSFVCTSYPSSQKESIPHERRTQKRGVNFRFSITQENAEIKFLNDLVKFFNCGQIYPTEGDKGKGSYYVSSKKDIESKIIPFFADKNKLQTIKKYSFLNFMSAFEICKNNKPLLENHYEELKILSKKNKEQRPSQQQQESVASADK